MLEVMFQIATVLIAIFTGAIIPIGMSISRENKRDREKKEDFLNRLYTKVEVMDNKIDGLAKADDDIKDKIRRMENKLIA